MKSLGLKPVAIQCAHCLHLTVSNPLAKELELRTSHQVQARPVHFENVLRWHPVAFGFEDTPDGYLLGVQGQLPLIAENAEFGF